MVASSPAFCIFNARSARFDVEPKVMMFGSYSKGYANPDSDIDVAVIVPTYGDRKFEISKKLWHDVDQVSFLIEPNSETIKKITDMRP